MDLKRRLSLANAATVIIPVVITCIMALAFIFIAGKLFHTDISFANYQRLSQIRLELINSENSILQQSPAMVEEKSFQNGLQARLAAIGGELIVVKADNVL
ncbi:MAG: sensor histidine kinase, partial [Peptococcaceae bacterium]|nr:sensor histidine kinase [Peptococcaceae bacterium]